MSLQCGILGFLNYGTMTGYDIDKAFKESADFFWRAQTSQIYRELSSMEKQGLVTFNRIMQEDKPNKKEYQITEKGKETLCSWLAQDAFDESFNHRNAFLLKLFFSGERPLEETISSLKAFQEHCKQYSAPMRDIGESIENYESCIDEEAKALFWGLTASFGRYYFDMCIKWSGDAIRELESRAARQEEAEGL